MMAQWFRMCSALLEDLSFVLSSHQVIHNCLQLHLMELLEQGWF